MKFSRPIFCMLFMLALGTGILTAKTNRQDSILLARIFSFQRNYTHDVRGFATNVYIKHLYQTHRRNVGLWAIPSTYAIAKGERTFVSEQYSRLYFRKVSDFDHMRQVYYTTIPRNRRTLPILSEFITPNLYDVTMYGDHVLSPFCKENRLYYKYSSVDLGHGKMRLYFRPRVVTNTQLVKGRAIVNKSTGQIEQLEMEGEYDMIHFRTLTQQGDNGTRALLPKLCKTSIEFKFAGNHITSDFTALYDCPITLPDTLDVEGDRLLIDSIRPISLSEAECAVYHVYDSLHNDRPDTAEVVSFRPDSIITTEFKQELQAYTILDDDEEKVVERHEHDYVKEIGWDIIGKNLIHSIRGRSANGYFRFSPILDPQYISYSSSKGISYKLKLYGEYRFSPNLFLEARPYAGYLFKRRELYYDIPIWLYYGPKQKGSWFLDISQSNRIGNQETLDELTEKLTDVPVEEIENRKWHFFGDNMIRLSHSIAINSKLSISSGITYHLRKSLHSKTLRDLGMTDKYQSFAPAFSVSWRPWPKAPMFTVDYERAIKTKHFNIDYERWEADVSAIHNMKHLQTLNLRLGAGIYTRRGGNHFMDFANFRDNNLPEGWNDDWSGEFQLLSSSLYNASHYYIRGNVSYESPLLCGYLTPLLGRYVERERFYWNGLNIEQTRLYSELGYGFTTRFVSIGLFASFLNLDYQEFTTKFTFELFRRW